MIPPVVTLHDVTPAPPILPGATIGFLGGGQLGRMSAMAARAMGYDVHVLDPDPACPARAVASRVITAPFDDADAAADLASHCAVVTLEIELIARSALDAAAEHAPLRPNADAIYIIQDRLRQREFLSTHQFSVGPFRAAHSEEDIANAIDALGPSIAKACHGGYDGRGQVRLHDRNAAQDTWDSLGGRTCLVEQHLSLELELSVLVARSATGEVAVYPPSRNHHAGGILIWSVAPAELHEGIAERAQTLARGIAEALNIVGLLGVEMFLTTDGQLLVNELAPRPHNSYHHSERAFVTGQFEQHIRAVCGLPLGSTELVTPAAIANLLGDVWLQDTPPDIAAGLTVPTSRLHLYGKASARYGRKMGHLSATGVTPAEAVERVRAAYRRLAHHDTA